MGNQHVVDASSGGAPEPPVSSRTHEAPEPRREGRCPHLIARFALGVLHQHHVMGCACMLPYAVKVLARAPRHLKKVGPLFPWSPHQSRLTVPLGEGVAQPRR